MVSRRVRLAAFLCCCVGTVVVWLGFVPAEIDDLELVDLAVVGTGLGLAGATTVYITRFSLPVLEVGFGLFTYGYLIQLLDEIAETAELIESVGPPGLKLAGLAVIFVGFTRATTRLRSNLAERKRRERELRRQNERLDTFASVVSHDLRNPLGIAQTYLDFAEDTGDPEDFAVTREALNRIDRMIENLLTLARAETVVDDPDPAVLADIARDAWRTTGTDGAELTVELPDDWTVDGDGELLQNVFENCFRNSVDHNDPPVSIRTGLLDSKTGFYVEDDGVGVPADQREAVFEHGHTTSEDGTGFGLSIVSDLVEAHGWTITVTESADGGARFEIVTEP